MVATLQHSMEPLFLWRPFYQQPSIKDMMIGTISSGTSYQLTQHSTIESEEQNTYAIKAYPFQSREFESSQ